MTPEARKEQITAIVAVEREVTVESLASRLSVSRETVRRDLSRLDRLGLLRKVHGGAKATGQDSDDPRVESSYATRISHNAEAKRRIATATARRFKPGDSIFIDAGSTTLAVAEALAGRSHLTVITNSARIAALVGAGSTNKVFMIGGAYNAEVGENLGPLAVEQIGRFRAQHAILTIGGMDATSIMDFDLNEAEVARAMIERSESLTVVADHSKLGQKAVFEVASLGQISCLVTDQAPAPMLDGVLRAAGVAIVVADS